MGVHYVFVSDLDRFACYGLRRDQRKREYPCLDESQIVVVNREIESWYLAGLDEATCGQLGVPFLQQTDGFTKERFTTCGPIGFATIWTSCWKSLTTTTCPMPCRAIGASHWPISAQGTATSALPAAIPWKGDELPSRAVMFLRHDADPSRH